LTINRTNEVKALPRIGAITLNWNRRDDTLRCIESLLETRNSELDVFVVDNASDDDSVNAIKHAFPEITLIQNDQNLGFAEGNNVAIRRLVDAGYEFLLLINNDAVLAPDSLSQMMDVMLGDPSIGMVGPTICYLDSPDVVWSAGGTINWSTGDVNSTYFNHPAGNIPREPFDVDHMSGCCMLLRTAAIDAAGVLDPRFFMYYEESEWCVRIGRHGFRLVICPQALSWHAISPRAQEGSPSVAYYMTRNHLLFLKATHAPWRAWKHTTISQIRTVVSLFIDPHTPERARGRVPMLRALRDFALGHFGKA
jgi:GT2 family glycosyltransferase